MANQSSVDRIKKAGSHGAVTFLDRRSGVKPESHAARAGDPAGRQERPYRTPRRELGGAELRDADLSACPAQIASLRGAGATRVDYPQLAARTRGAMGCLCGDYLRGATASV